MGAREDVAAILDSSPLANHMSTSDAEGLSVDMKEIGTYLAMLVEELCTLHHAVLTLGARVDELARAA